MPPRGRAPDLVRLVEGVRGRVPMRMQLVVIGNGAVKQRQLDVPGELMDAMHMARVEGMEPDTAAWQLQRAVVGFVESIWPQPDEGIWEMRGQSRHFTQLK